MFWNIRDSLMFYVASFFRWWEFMDLEKNIEGKIGRIMFLFLIKFLINSKLRKICTNMTKNKNNLKMCDANGCTE